MKRSVLIAIAIISIASLAFAQGGSIGVFADPGGTACNFVDAGSLVQVYFFHVNHIGATASQWKLDLGGLPWMHLGDTWNVPTTIGSSVFGISLGYGGCLPAPSYLGVANFFGSVSPVCSTIQIVPDPLAPTGTIESVDCTLPQPIKYVATGGTGILNSDGTCNCNIPVEETTWGGVKALYQ